MAATDIKSVLELLRTKVYNASSSTSLDELNSMVKTAQLAHTPMIRHYDSDGSLPTATSSEERLAFITSTGSIKMNNGRRWEATTSSSSGGGGGTPDHANNQGIAYGYAASGKGYVWPYSATDTIEKYSFSADGNATDVGDLYEAKMRAAGSSSYTNGYVHGGMGPNYSNIIEKFPYSSDGNASDIANLTVARMYLAGASSTTHGYAMGGSSPDKNTIDKYPFSVDADATDVGDLLSNRAELAGTSSTTHGYAHGGGPYNSSVNIIQKLSFSVDGNSTDVGDLTNNNAYITSGANSDTHGYRMGGSTGPTPTLVNTIDKYSYSSDGNATDVGDCLIGLLGAGGSSSTTHGYAHGGEGSPTYGTVDTIQKFSFSVDGNSTDVGNLTAARKELADNLQV